LMAASRTSENNFILISPVKFRERHDGVRDYCQEDNRRCRYLEASIGAESPNNYKSRFEETDRTHSHYSIYDTENRNVRANGKRRREYRHESKVGILTSSWPRASSLDKVWSSLAIRLPLTNARAGRGCGFP